MGVVNNYFLITFQISYELQLHKIIIDLYLNTAKWIVLGCCKCISFAVHISFYEKLHTK